MNKLIFILLAILGTSYFRAQNDSISNSLSISGYAEIYYQTDFNNPQNNSRPGFVYSHNRNNEINVNLAFIKAGYTTDNLRANLALAAGTYMNANYAAEQGVLKNVYEANIGLKIFKNHHIWIDAGVFPSHLGFESAVGKDNWTLSRSLFAENSPYFETGAKISYTSPTGRWLLSALVLNGWQRIQRVDGNSTPAFGHQITFKPNHKLTLNSGSFIGNDKQDSIKQMRYFHNLYGIYQFNKKLGITAGFDIGAEQSRKGSHDYHIWYTPILLLKYNFTERFGLAARGEYYQDKKGVIISTDTENGFQTFGYSLNADYYILPNLVWRTEIRNLNSKDAIFINRSDEFNKNSLTVITALAISF